MKGEKKRTSRRERRERKERERERRCLLAESEGEHLMESVRGCAVAVISELQLGLTAHIQHVNIQA
jgi:hypothetical protein